MSFHIVRKIKRECYSHIQVKNALDAMGYYRTKGAPKNINKLLEGLPRQELEKVLHIVMEGK